MTPEERAEECCSVPREITDWSKFDSGLFPIDIKRRIAEAIRAAEADAQAKEREAILELSRRFAYDCKEEFVEAIRERKG